MFMKHFKKLIIIFFFVLCVALSSSNFYKTKAKCYSAALDPLSIAVTEESENGPPAPSAPKKDFVKWVDFNASSTIINKAYEADLALKKLGEKEIGIVEILSYITLKNGNSFNIKRDTLVLNKLMTGLKTGDKSELEKYKDNKYYKYYLDCYHAIFDGIIGEYTTSDGEAKYGLTGYFPLARGFWFNDYDDFGNSRGYGYKRRHLGHDMFGGIGTPIIAVEGGTITELGWNQYGGWRIGIRSGDSKRYYYYAHLRRNKPFPSHLKLGDTVKAGQVIGFLGVTGYSRKENTNMTSTNPHLHFGLQLIFDKSQEDGNGEIWIDVYQLTKFLAKNKMPVAKNAETNEYESKLKI